MASAAVTTSKVKEPLYSYKNENAVSQQLVCVICRNIFIDPVQTTVCGHTFCRSCIEKAVQRNNNCPICRMEISNESNNLTSSLLIRNQVDELLVKCKLCNESNIERGHFENHCRNCSKRIVKCPRADIGCPWSGQSDKLDKHTKHCQFQLFYAVLRPLETKMNHFKETVREQRNMIQQLQNNNQQLTAQIVKHEQQIKRLKQRLDPRHSSAIYNSDEDESDQSDHTNMSEINARQGQYRPMIANLTIENRHNPSEPVSSVNRRQSQTEEQKKCCSII